MIYRFFLSPSPHSPQISMIYYPLGKNQISFLSEDSMLNKNTIKVLVVEPERPQAWQNSSSSAQL